MPNASQTGSVVEAILANELSSLASEAREGRKDHKLTVLDQRGAAEELIREQYTGRYPFELLQNANDACASRKEEEGHDALAVEFVLTDDALIVADQGTGFGPREVKAICGFAQTSKDPRKSVGYKGLGFKSVGEISNQPQVVSGDVLFGFDPGLIRQKIEERVGPLPEDQRIPTYPFPCPLSEADFGTDWEKIDQLRQQGHRTVFRLPLKPEIGRQRVAEDLGGMIVPRLLVLLDGIGRLSVSGTESDFDATAVRDDSEAFEEVLLEVDGSDEHWLVSRERLSVPSELLDPLGDQWREVDEVGVAAAIPLDDRGRLNTRSDPQPLHVYFPTEEATQLPIILHGDFPLDPDRRFIARSEKASAYREWLASRLAELVAEEVAPALTSRWPEDGRVVQILAPRGQLDGFGGQCVQKILEGLSTARFLPCIDGHIRMPGEATHLPRKLPNAPFAHHFLDAEAANRLVVGDAEKTLHARKFLDLLQVKTLSEEDVAELIRPPDPTSYAPFHEWLVDWFDRSGRGLGESLGRARIALTNEMNWVSPSDEGVFFPRERGEAVPVAELPISIVQVPDVDGSQALLASAGVQPFRWRELLTESVLPVLRNPHAPDENRDRMLRILQSYFFSEGGGDQEIRQQAGGVLLAASRAQGEGVELRRADEIYFSESWLGHDRLERVYGPFGEQEFLIAPPPEDGREQRKAFLEWLGVAVNPRVLTASTKRRNRYLLQHLNRHPHRNEEFWNRWLKSEPVEDASKCPQGHPQSQQLRVSHTLDRFSELVETEDWHRLNALFKELAIHWGGEYQDKLEAVFYCKNKRHSGKRPRRAPSLLGFSLRTEPWIPAVVEGHPVLRTPSEVWRPPHGVSPKVASSLPILPDELDELGGAISSDLGIIDGARPQPSELVTSSRRIADSYGSDLQGDDRLIALARWILRKLDDALSRKPISKGDLKPLPLLAKHGDEHLFTEEPYVARESVIEETWRDEVPVLDADREVRTLPRILDLPDLSDELEVTPNPSGTLPDLSKQLEEELGRASPFLAAIAIDRARTRANTVFARLPRIQVVACRELKLLHRLGDREKTIYDVEAHVESRLERDGQTSRRIGTAFLEVNNRGEAPWYALGPPLAEFLEVASQGDAFALLLAGDEKARLAYLRSKSLSLDDVRDARRRLRDPEQPPDPLQWEPPRREGREHRSGEGTPPSKNTETEGPTPEPPSRKAGEHTPEEEDGSSRGESDEDVSLPPLQPDLVELTEPARVRVEPPSEKPVNPTKAGGRKASAGRRIDWKRRLETSRRHGERGERLVVHKERQRLEENGLDGGAVEWVSKEDELSPYDIGSLDESGRPIYIEVKSTARSERHAPFKISSEELNFAFDHRDRYYIYRVLDITSAVPQVLVYEDPVRRLLEGHAQIKVSEAKIYMVPT